jgi:hypothetical protein
MAVNQIELVVDRLRSASSLLFGMDRRRRDGVAPLREATPRLPVEIPPTVL